MRKILVGAVAYAPQIVPIWDTIREYANAYYKDSDLSLDYVLFSNYETQVQYLLEGKIDIAWNTNVAYIRSMHACLERDFKVEAILMRDTDLDFKSVFVTKDERIKNIADLVGKSFGLGSLDSAQAAIMPLYSLKPYKIKEFSSNTLGLQSLAADSINIFRFNSDVGKHGDTGRSEFDVLDRISSGELAAGAIGSTTWARIMQEGSYGGLRSFYMSEGYSHCNFSVLSHFDSGLKRAFIEMMCSQNALKNDPKIAQMMSLEGLNEWIVCDEVALGGYEGIYKALLEQNLLT